jgi:predicted acylesterase/phospholipase RssA
VKGKAEIQKPADEAGTIAVNSVPDGAEVYVDGSFVGNAPATLRLAPGKHTIGVTAKGYKDWSRELSVLTSSDVKLMATLDKQE